MVSVLEATMLVCFGFSWPINVLKAYRARSAKGMSLPFICLILGGYIAGISAKVLSGTFNYVLAVYFFNLAIVTVNLLMYFRNLKLDMQKESNKEVFVMKAHEKEINKYNKLNAFAAENGVVLFGSEHEGEIPINEMKQALNLDFGVYNRTVQGMSVVESSALYESMVAPINPECVIINIGENDLDYFKNSSSRFDKDFRDLIQRIRYNNKSVRIGIATVAGEKFKSMNAQLKYIAESEGCEFCDMTGDIVFNPMATQLANEYFYSTSYGTHAKRPVYALAKMFFGHLPTSEITEPASSFQAHEESLVARHA